MAYTDQEKYVMIGIKELQRGQKPATPAAIRQAGRWATLDKDEQMLAAMLDRLVGIDLVARAGDSFTLTARGAALAKRFDAEGFGN